jgi:hypothetical protein
MNPEDLGCQRWRPLRRAVEQRNRLVRELNETNKRLTALREQLPRAAQTDREAYAAELAQGKAEPERQAEQITAGIEIEQRRAEACILGIENAERELRKLCGSNAAWRSEQLRSIAKARSAYQDSIRRLEADRDALGNEVTLFGWLRTGDVGSPVRDGLSGHIAADASGRPPLSFAHVVQALSTDAESIAAHLSEPDPSPPWSRIKDHAEALVGQGLSREEAVQRAGPSGWGGE